MSICSVLKYTMQNVTALSAFRSPAKSFPHWKNFVATRPSMHDLHVRSKDPVQGYPALLAHQTGSRPQPDVSGSETSKCNASSRNAPGRPLSTASRTLKNCAENLTHVFASCLIPFTYAHTPQPFEAHQMPLRRQSAFLHPHRLVYKRWQT